MRLRQRVVLQMLAAAMLTACATTRPPADSGWISGRLSVRVAATANQPAQSLSAGFDLRGSGDSGELRLNTPLGTQLVSARWAPGVAVLVDSQGEQRYASLDELSRRAVGESLPLAALPDWLVGRPWAGAPSRPSVGSEPGFEQLGWRVLLARRAEGLIEARRDAAPAVDVRVKLDDPT